MNPKQLFISLLSLVVILSGVSLADAAGVWKNPTATPPANNVDAPINVGTTAQDKAGVLRVTGFRSFFDAIFDTKVQIGTTATMPTSLKLLVDGKVGAEAYCDRQGNNCVTSSGIAVSSTNTNTSNSSSCGPGSIYNSGWVAITRGGEKTLNHNLGTEDTVVFMEYKAGPSPDAAYLKPNSINSLFLHHASYSFYKEKTANQITIRTEYNAYDVGIRYFKVILKKEACL